MNFQYLQIFHSFSQDLQDSQVFSKNFVKDGKIMDPMPEVDGSKSLTTDTFCGVCQSSSLTTFLIGKCHGWSLQQLQSFTCSESHSIQTL